MCKVDSQEVEDMEDHAEARKSGDPRAIISAIVALLHTLSVVVEVDISNVIAKSEKKERNGRRKGVVVGL